MEQKRKELAMLDRRTTVELQSALDLAGQVYIIGTGSNNQFVSQPRKDFSIGKYTVDGFDRVLRAWKHVSQP